MTTKEILQMCIRYQYWKQSSLCLAKKRQQIDAEKLMKI